MLVDDGPRARTGEIMAKAASKDSHVVAVCLMRNHDHQLAPTTGLTLCRREPILIIEADLQDPPEFLPEMMPLMDQGAGVATASVAGVTTTACSNA